MPLYTQQNVLVGRLQLACGFYAVILFRQLRTIHPLTDGVVSAAGFEDGHTVQHLAYAGDYFNIWTQRHKDQTLRAALVSKCQTCPRPWFGMRSAEGEHECTFSSNLKTGKGMRGYLLKAPYTLTGYDKALIIFSISHSTTSSENISSSSSNISFNESKPVASSRNASSATFFTIEEAILNCLTSNSRFSRSVTL